ncbi:SRPBCC domain-containing protein [uncultured Psychroserpens sp.]|uniref:SRPBCC family protein n=1 Tax=uncultured Psychroserpens sp. TaxID=255436 RepID=UPI00261C5C99|nr:SRPBCC domain-containing protein [uncultured Psychroserpens sp.]
MKISEGPIIIEHSFDQSKERLWKAITELNEMKQWFFNNIPAFKAEVGFETTFTVISEDRVFTHEWKIMEVIPLHKICYNWKYSNYKGDAIVSFELFEDSNKTKLILTTNVIEDFSDTIPEFKRESCIAGWNYFIKDSLVNYFKSN